MERLVDARHPIHDLLRRRWSPRAFDDRPVEVEKLRSVMEAARWAPSSSNEQPWSYLVATKEDPAAFQQMLSCLVEKNQQWAKTAPVLMISVASLRFQRSQQPNRHALHDVGLASGFLIVEATALGLYAHLMAGFGPEKAREIYGLPEHTEAVAAIAMGYLGDPATLPDDLRSRETSPSPRRPISEFVFSGQWGRPADWVAGQA